MTDRPTVLIARGPSRLVRALRVLILLAITGVVVGTAITWGRRGPRQAAITMTEPGGGLADVTEQSERFSASGTREGRPAFDLAAATVTGLQGDKKLLSSVQLDVHEAVGRIVNVLGREGEFDPAGRRALLRGDVGIRTPDGMSLETPNLSYDSDRDMIHTSDPIKFRLGSVEGSGEGLNYLVGERRLKIPARVRLVIQAEDGGGPVLITSGSLVASLSENSAVFTEQVRLERGADILTGNYLRIDLDAAREQVTAMRAFGEVSVAMSPDAAGRPGSLQADSLVLSIGAGNVLEQAEASGGCRFSSGLYTSTSRTALYRKSDDRLELRGDPSVVTDRDRVAAQEIDLFPGRQALEARGEVRTTTLGEARTDLAGFGSGDAVSFQAARLLVEQESGRATYSGGARAWQDGVSLQADEIRIDRAAKQIRGDGAVVSRFTPKPTAKTPRPPTTTIAARHLVIDDATGTAHYQGDTRLARPDATLTADSMDVRLRESAKRREIDRILAKGAVSVRHEGSYATASEAEYLADRQLLVLRDAQGLAEVVDGATGRAMRGRELTYDLAGNRVSTESGPGGRTWITVSPDVKGPARVEPPSRH